MARAFDRVGQATATTGNGTVTLGAALTDGQNGNYQTFNTAGVAAGDFVNYLITDGAAWELGTGIYTVSGPTLTRNLLASSTGSLLALSGNAKVFSVPFASDLVGVGDGCCRISGTMGQPMVTLSPFNGNKLIIGNTPVTIPAAGIQYDCRLVTSAQIYNVYAYLNTAGGIALELSTTTYAADANGRMTKSGDTSRRLVGRLNTSGGSSPGMFQSCINWFNRRRVAIATSVSGSTASSSYVNCSDPNYQINWAEEQVTITLIGKCIGAVYVFTRFMSDGANQIGAENYCGYNNAWDNCSMSCTFSQSEAQHTYTVQGAAYGGGTISYSGTLIVETMG